MNNNQKHSNYGHRKRIRDKVKKHGIGVLCDHELVEFLLCIREEIPMILPII